MAQQAVVHIRKYQPHDRAVVRRLCCETGFLGNPIDPVFEDRELFADYLTKYYTDLEPESAFVVEHEKEVKGYLLGSRRPLRHQMFSLINNFSLFFRGMARYSSYTRASRDFIGWVLRNSWREVPAAPRRSAHFHFNMLPEVQSVAGTRLLFNLYMDYLRSCGENSVFGQIVTFEDRRGAKLFQRYGFEIVEKREITKYRSVCSEPVYLTTVIKKLSPAEEIQNVG